MMMKTQTRGRFDLLALGLLISLLLVQNPLTAAHSRRIPGSGPGFKRFFGSSTSSSSSSTPSPLLLETNAAILELRGGAKRSTRKSGGRTASLSSLDASSSSKKKASSLSATGKKKVGAAKEAEEKKSAIGDTMEKYKKMLPLTRIHLTAVVVVTAVGFLLGEETAQEVLSLNPASLIYGLQLWRPISAATFLGPPSLSWLMNGYYLYQYGSTLERAYGTAQHCMFLLTQLISLSMFSILLGQPFFAPSVITSMLHVLSRSAPRQKAKWIIFTVPYWSLPYGLMLADALQAKSPMALIPHLTGILSGHIYYFHKFVWPRMGHTDWLVPPEFIRKRLDPEARKEEEKEKATTKARKRSKGRKLGGK